MVTEKVKFSKEQIVQLCNPIFEDLKECGCIFTRSGMPVIVFSPNGGGNFPIVGMYWNNEEWIPTKWMADGRYPSINEKLVVTDLDLDLNPETYDKESA